jgi:4-hydroxy-tetrahydrodipicolinate synthase
MKIEGIVCAMVTPMDAAQDINLEATRKLVDRLIENGIGGIFILGTNGEFHVLTNEEKLNFAREVVKMVKHRVPVFAGTGGNSTREVIELSRKMEKTGVDALAVITPFLVPISQHELAEHYKKVAASVTLPIFLYNIPKNTGINISPEVAAELADVENICGIKDSSGDINNIEGYIKAGQGKDFVVLSGSDSLILKALKLGAVGAVASTSNLLTKTDVAIFREFKAGNLAEAQKNQDAIEKLRKVSKLATIPSVIKRAVTLSGIDVGDARLPVLPVPEEVNEQVREMLQYYGM